jgi:methyl-accepting chemotaxis protein
MAEVKSAIRQVAGIVDDIAVASDEQRRGIEEVNQAVNQMDCFTQQNAALVAQAAAAARSLEEQGVHLKNAVAVFTLGSADCAPVNRVTTRTRPWEAGSLSETHRLVRG